ncbi:MAG: hypothetical protein ACXVPN_06565 [Bacteroidia bacterium]
MKLLSIIAALGLVTLSAASKMSIVNHGEFTYAVTEHEKYKACIDACNTCIASCKAAEKMCAKEANMKECHKLCKECIAACEKAVKEMKAESKDVGKTCGECAKACEKCAAECSKYDMPELKKCTVDCRNAAAHCNGMK